ncbi:hypothetical protein AKO1_007023 [Acrasis kona]|uniref:nicotinamidase n=1 Tax=Acrasis kona TaxID=1008807 RepID=A0AAW2YV95_9EUKA
MLTRILILLFVTMALAVYAKNDKKALLIIDVQKDFCKSGSLEVPNADEVVPIFNNLRSSVKWDSVMLTADWHPEKHVSFASTHEVKEFTEIVLPNGSKQMMWPDHCVQRTDGAKFHSDLVVKKSDVIVHKGTNLNVDSYSGFFDNDGESQTELNFKLQERGIKSVYIGGLALNVCVTYTCLDAVKLGFKTHLILDASRGLGDAQNKAAIKKLKAAGVIIINSRDIIRSFRGLKSASS